MATWSGLCQKITEIIEIVHDSPRVWIDKNEAGIRGFARYPGPSVLLAALTACVNQGGKLDYFIQDFGKWKVRAPVNETAEEYFSRQGLTAAARLNPHEEMVQWRRERETEDPTGERGHKFFTELKKRFPVQAPK